MKVINSKLKLLAFHSWHYFSGHQDLVHVYYVFGIKVFTRVLDREEIPSWALISWACFGDTSGWKSKFQSIKEVW